MRHSTTSTQWTRKADAWRREAVDTLGYDPPQMERRIPVVSFAGRIEHTLLKMDASVEDMETLCREAVRFGFRSVCILPKDVASAKRLARETGVLVVTVLNFPLAGSTAAAVESECRQAIDDGADEVDMVLDVRALLGEDLKTVRDGVDRVVQAADGRAVKVILETGLLSPRQIALGTLAAEAGGALFVKTSTGFGPRGASLEDVMIMRAVVGEGMGIKASGGIRERAFAHALVDAGADLIGTSSGPQLVG